MKATELTMTDSQAVAAIRLALEAAADDRAAVVVIKSILHDVADSDPADTESVHRLVDAIKRSGAELRLA